MSDATAFIPSIYKLRPGLQVSAPKKQAVSLDQDPIECAQAIIEAHNQKSKTQYGVVMGVEQLPMQDWKMRVYWARHPQKNPFVSFLEKITQVENPNWKGETTSFLAFLWRAISKTGTIECFALAFNKAGKVVRPYADFSFPRQVARRCGNPSPHGIEYRPLVGVVAYGKNFYKPESGQGEIGSLCDSMWTIFKGFETTVAKGSSLESLVWGLAKPQTSSATKKKAALKTPRPISMEVTFAHLRVKQLLSPEAILGLVDHCAKIGRGEKTWRLNEKQERVEEVDDVAFTALDNIVAVESKNLRTALDAASLVLLWEDFQKGAAQAPISIAHKQYEDYYSSPEFVFSYNKETKRLYSPPSYWGFMSALRYLYRELALADLKGFGKALRKTTLTYAHHDAPVKVLSLVHSQVRHEGGLYFFVDGVWLQIVGDQLAILERDFYQMVQSTLLKSGDNGAISDPWLVKEEWARASSQEIARLAQMSPEQVESILLQLTQQTYRVLNSIGGVCMPYVTRSLFITDEGAKVDDFKDIRRKSDALNRLLREKASTNGLVEIDDLNKVFQNEEESKAVLRLLKTAHPIARGFSEKVHQVVLDEEGRVVNPNITDLRFTETSNPFTKNLVKIENLLRTKLGKVVTAQDILACPKMQQRSADKIMRILKAGGSVDRVASWQMNGPPPDTDSLPPLLRELLGRLHDFHRLVGEEEGFNRSFLGRPGYLVFDQVYAGKGQKFELCDLIDYSHPGELYLIQNKEGLSDHAVSQIRTAARQLKSAIAVQDDVYLTTLFKKATSEQNKSPFREELRKSLAQLPSALNDPKKDALGCFLDLFKRPKIVFVLAFIDSAVHEKPLGAASDPGKPITEQLGEDWCRHLMQHGMLDKFGRISSTFITTCKKDFQEKLKLNPEQMKYVYPTLEDCCSPYDKLMMKVELVQLWKEIKDSPFELRINQLSRQGILSAGPPKQLPPSGVQMESLLMKGASRPAADPPLQPIIALDHVGLPNIGNSPNEKGNQCFINSVLQLIFNTPLAPFFANPNNIDPINGQQVSQHITSIQSAYQQMRQVPDTRVFRAPLRFSIDEQEDAHEFFCKILGCYKKSGLATRSHYVRQLDLSKRGPTTSTRPQELSEATDQGTVVSAPEEHFPPIVPLPEGCLPTSTALQQWLAPHVQEPQNAIWQGQAYLMPTLSETLVIDHLPDDLFMTLGIYDLQKCKNRRAVLDSPNVTINQLPFAIKAFVAHTGPSANLGHYTAYVNFSEYWICFDDEQCIRLSNFEAVQSHLTHFEFDPYILYLKKC
ncbi:MAG: hypothetical protein AB7M93_25990 [Candidatus Obscuribacterales bacterium]